MYVAPLANENLENNIQNLTIFQDNNKYLLRVKANREQLTLTLSEIDKINSKTYSIIMSLNEVKQIHKSFSLINSCKDFSDYLLKLSKNNQLFVNKKENEKILTFTTEYLLNVDIIEIILLPQRIDVEKKLIEACNEIENLKKKINNLEKKDEERKKEINELKNQNKDLKDYIKEKIKDLNIALNSIRNRNTSNRIGSNNF